MERLSMNRLPAERLVTTRLATARLAPSRSPVSLSALVAVLAVAMSAAAPLAADWPTWRGPAMDGLAGEQRLPEAWDRETNVRWRLELPGPAASTPVIEDDRIYLTTTVDGEPALRVMAVSTAGRLLWSDEPDAGTLEVFERFASETSLASPSPAIGGGRLYVLFGTGQLLAYWTSSGKGGEVLWQRDLKALHGEPRLYFGLSSSPLYHDGRLYLQLLHGGRQAVVAVDAASGEDLWVIERETDAKKECLHAYTSPLLYGRGKAAQLVIHGADHTTAHSLKDGREIWRHGGLNPAESYNPSLRLVATPVVAGDWLIVPSAKRGPVYALKPKGAKGELTNTAKAVWKIDRGTPDVPSPLVYDGLVYLAGENGRLSVYELATGELHYQERVHQSTHRASPVAVDGKILLIATDGTVSVVRAGRAYELLAKNELGERLAASPAISGDTLYLRSYESLWAIGAPAPAPASDAKASKLPKSR